MSSRRLRRSVLSAALAGLLSTGCAPTSEPPAPTPGFASEAEAFAAAEQTYRDYVDALNRVDLSDPATFEDVYALTTGEANAGAREEFSAMHADGLTVSGTTVAKSIVIVSGDWRAGSVELGVCLDVGDVELTDPGGASVVDSDRRDHQPMLVSMQEIDSSDARYRISSVTGSEGAPGCER